MTNILYDEDKYKNIYSNIFIFKSELLIFY